MVDYLHAPTGTLPSIRLIADETVLAARAAGFNVQVCYGYATTPDHNNKRCVDFMVAGEGSEQAGGAKGGDWIANYLWAHRVRHGLNWQIWNRRIRRYQNTERPLGAWYSYTGGAPHTDHVHAEFDGTPYQAVKPVKSLRDRTKTGLRVMTVNCRLSSIVDAHPWSSRRTAMLKLLKDNPASVIGVQECSDNIGHDMLAALGPTWRLARHNKVGLLYDDAKWQRLAMHSFNLDNETEPDQRLLLVLLESKATLKPLWFVVSHFGVHFKGEAAERINQAVELLGYVKTLGIVDGVVLGDFNDYPRPPKKGVRTTLQGPPGVSAGVFYDLRHCTTVSNAEFDTHHGYKPSARTGQWTDDILTSENVVVLEGRLILTDPGSKYPNATDHNVLAAYLEY